MNWFNNCSVSIPRCEGHYSPSCIKCNTYLEIKLYTWNTNRPHVCVKLTIDETPSSCDYLHAIYINSVGEWLHKIASSGCKLTIDNDTYVKLRRFLNICKSRPCVQRCEIDRTLLCGQCSFKRMWNIPCSNGCPPERGCRMCARACYLYRPVIIILDWYEKNRIPTLLNISKHWFMSRYSNLTVLKSSFAMQDEYKNIFLSSDLNCEIKPDNEGYYLVDEESWAKDVKNEDINDASPPDDVGEFLLKFFYDTAKEFLYIQNIKRVDYIDVKQFNECGYVGEEKHSEYCGDSYSLWKKTGYIITDDLESYFQR